MNDPFYPAFIDEVRTHFENMCKEHRSLYVTEADCLELWQIYLDSIPREHNPIFRKRRRFDCSACRNFFRNCANVVAIENGHLVSIWDFEASDYFKDVAKKLSDAVKALPIDNRFFPRTQSIGQEKTPELCEDGQVITWHHLYAKVPAAYVVDPWQKSELLGEAKTTKEVFGRSLTEISLEAIDIVLELIAQNSLYRGEEWKGALQDFRKYKTEYDHLPEDRRVRDLYLWEKSVQVGNVIARIKNHSMGTLLANISEEMDLEQAVRQWERIMAPTNYKRPQAIFTQRMLDEARETIEKLGFMDSLLRRFATLNDIRVNDILFSNRDAARRIIGATGAESFFTEMKKEVKADPKQFSRVQTIGIQEFVEKVLPTARSLEVFFENRHIPNLVSLIAPVNPQAPTLFKWGNGFSWAYRGNVADSLLKERVKNAGGKVDGVLRFSIQWNDLERWNQNDEDAHCIEPNGFEIYFGKKVDSATRGNLDVDITHPQKNVPAVENITWPSLDSMKPGDYRFFVHTFAGRGGTGGFRAEVEADGELHSYDYSQNTRNGGKVEVAVVNLSKDGYFTIKDILPSGVTAHGTTVWGITTNQFVPVSVVCLSPNWWDEANGVGNRHYFFMLKDCANDESPNGFYNEQLRNELGPHKRVLEMLGLKAKVQDTPDQLSGLGFSSTKHAELVVKVTGTSERILKIVF